MSQRQLATYATVAQPFTSSCYLVIDIGGGTVDISAHQVNMIPKRHIKVIHPPSGNDCGGTKVNKKFAQFLEELVGDSGFSDYISTGNEIKDASHKAYLNELINETFETQKRFFGTKCGVGGKVSIRLHYTFMETYKSRIESGIQKLDDPRIELSGTNLRIAFSKVEEFYTPVTEGILKCIADTLGNVKGKVEKFYIVGGFGGCHYLYKKITERFGDVYSYITPSGPDFAVVLGAVLFRRNPDVVESRQADATYGVRVSIPFVEGLHDEEYKWVNSKGESQCANIFSTFVERGQVVTTTEVVVRKYQPQSSDQKVMHIDIYTSPEKGVWYTTGKQPRLRGTQALAEVIKVGELIIPLRALDPEKPQGADKDKMKRDIEVTFDFSSTEIQVKGYDQLAGTEIKTVLDFLSS